MGPRRQCESRKRDSLLARHDRSAISHSQTFSTLQPNRRNLAWFRRSRVRFSWNLAAHHALRVFGRVERWHPWSCQKHPFTLMIFRRDANTRSGVPGSARTCSRYRNPMAWRRRRTFISGCVSLERTRDINRLRCRGVSTSVLIGICYPGDGSYAIGRHDPR